MLTVTFVDHRGEERTVSARLGYSLMEAARRADIPGILAECSGACACSTCRVFVDSAWVDLVGAAEARETALLDMVAEDRENVRLACQITLTPELDGLIVQTPERQH